MAKERVVKFDDELDVMIDEYVHANGIKINKLINLAVEKYISAPRTIELTPVDSDKWEKLTKETFAEHREAMDELK